MSVKLSGLSLVTLLGGCFAQIGAQAFAIAVLVRTASSAPPRSLEIYRIDHPYDSGAFWEVMPTINLALFIVAAIANWRTDARWCVLIAFALFAVSGMLQGLVVAPIFDELLRAPTSSVVDPALVKLGREWFIADAASWAFALASGLVLTFAAARMREGR